jgi:hypothetical protein
MKDLVPVSKLKKIERIAMDKGYSSSQEFVAFNAPKLLGKQILLKDLTRQEADILILRGK